MIVFFYYFGLVLLLGAEINAYFFSSRLEGEDPVHQEAGAQHHLSGKTIETQQN